MLSTNYHLEEAKILRAKTLRYGEARFCFAQMFGVSERHWQEDDSKPDEASRSIAFIFTPALKV